MAHLADGFNKPAPCPYEVTFWHFVKPWEGYLAVLDGKVYLVRTKRFGNQAPFGIKDFLQVFRIHLVLRKGNDKRRLLFLLNARLFHVFAKEHAKVVFTGRNKATGAQAEEALRKEGLETSFVQADVSNEQSMQDLMKNVHDQFGRIDILLHNASIYPEVRLDDMTLEDWDHVQNINLRGTFIAVKYDFARLRGRRSRTNLR